VTFAEDGTGAWTMVIEALAVPANRSVEVVLLPQQGLVGPAAVRLYESELLPTPEPTDDTLMQHRPDLKKTTDGGYALTVEGGHIYTVTTLPAIAEGPPAPAAKPPAMFPMPFVPDFEATAFDSSPRFMTQYEGSFSIVNDTSAGGTHTLKQWVSRNVELIISDPSS
jgi:hypothetical protein